jgi:hypothetical protein
MPDPEFNPKAKLMAISAIQEACTRINARLVELPEGVDVDDQSAVFELANGRRREVPVKALKTEKSRDDAIADLVDLLQKPTK